MKPIQMFCVLAMLVLPAATAYPNSTGQYKKELENSSKSLQDLQKSIKEKRIEKEKCLLDEKCIGVELSKIERELTRFQKKGDALKKDIKKNEKMLAQSENELKRAGWEKQQWINTLDSELNKWNQYHYSYNSLFRDNIDEQLRFEAVVQKRSYVGSALNKETMSRQAINRWQAAKDKLKELKGQQEKTLQDQESVRAQKKDILKSTIGRRVAAEADIAKLTESAKALEQMIIKLEKERKKTEQEAQEKRKFKEKKKHLIWPVEGEIVLKFGRNKHPDLDTYIISNGVKIRAAANSDVRSVGKGEVMFSGEFRSYGQMVIIDHGGGFFTIYGQLSEILVEEGQKVQEGTVIGKLGGAKQPVLYFEVRSESKPEDPELWLK